MDSTVAPYDRGDLQNQLVTRRNFFMNVYNWEMNSVDSIDVNVFRYYDRIIFKEKDRIKNLYMNNTCLKKQIDQPLCYDVVLRVYLNFINTAFFQTLLMDDEQAEQVKQYVRNIPRHILLEIVETKSDEDKQLYMPFIDFAAEDDEALKNIAGKLLQCFASINNNKFTMNWVQCEEGDIKKLAFMYVMIQEDKINKLIFTKYAVSMNEIAAMQGGMTGGMIEIILVILLVAVIVIVICSIDTNICVILAIFNMMNGGGFFNRNANASNKSSPTSLSPEASTNSAEGIYKQITTNPVSFRSVLLADAFVEKILSKRINEKLLSSIITKCIQPNTTKTNIVKKVFKILPIIAQLALPMFRAKMTIYDVNEIMNNIEQNYSHDNIQLFLKMYKLRNIAIDLLQQQKPEYFKEYQGTFVLNLNKSNLVMASSEMEIIMANLLNQQTDDPRVLEFQSLAASMQKPANVQPQYGGKKKGRQYITMKTTGKNHTVYHDENKKKYVKLNKSVVYLSDIKGKFTYLK